MTAMESWTQTFTEFSRANEGMLSAVDALIQETTVSSNALAEQIKAFITVTVEPRVDWQRILASIVAEQQASAVRWQQSLDSMTENIESVIEPILAQMRKADMLMKLGLVPHPMLYQYADQMLARSTSDMQDSSGTIVADVWPMLRPQLRLSLDDCLEDEKTAAMFDQLMRAHEAGLYDLTAPGAASLIERAARLTQVGCAPIKTKTWMEERVADVPASELRGGIPIWEVLKEQTFAGCSDDATADGMPYLSRHAAAHGFGAWASTQVDSLNAVLLAHFVILAAKAVKRCTDE